MRLPLMLPARQQRSRDDIGEELPTTSCTSDIGMLVRTSSQDLCLHSWLKPSIVICLVRNGTRRHARSGSRFDLR